MLKQTIRNILISSHSDILFSFIYSGMGSILMFHNVISAEEKKTPAKRLLANQGLEITPEYLETLIRYLSQKGYDFLSLEDVYQLFVSQRKHPRPFVVFTFDDGYLGNYTLAYPLLKKYQVPFTVYVASGFVDGQGSLWWYMLEQLLIQEEKITLSWHGEPRLFLLKTQSDKEAAFGEIRAYIMQQPLGKLECFLNDLFVPYGLSETDYLKRYMLSWDQIRHMAQDPMVTLGAHTVHHYPLKHLPEESAIAEIKESKHRIEAKIGKTVAHFAYPYGDGSAIGNREIPFAEQAGFKTATTTMPGNLFPEHGDYLHQLPRIFVSGADEEISRFKLALSGAQGALLNRFKKIRTTI